MTTSLFLVWYEASLPDMSLLKRLIPTSFVLSQSPLSISTVSVSSGQCQSRFLVSDRFSQGCCFGMAKQMSQGDIQKAIIFSQKVRLFPHTLQDQDLHSYASPNSWSQSFGSPRLHSSAHPSSSSTFASSQLRYFVESAMQSWRSILSSLSAPS